MENNTRIETLLENILDGVYQDKEEIIQAIKDIMDISFGVAKRNIDKAIENINHSMELAKGNKELEEYAKDQRATCLIQLSNGIISNDEDQDVDRNYIYSILINFENYKTTPNDIGAIGKFCKNTSVNHFSSVQNLLNCIKENLNYSINYSIPDTYLLKNLLKEDMYKIIYDIGLKYNINIEK